MNDASMDLLVVSEAANMNYLTGYDRWLFNVLQCVLVVIEAEKPFWIGRSMDASGARHTTFLHPENIIGYPYDYVQNPIKNPMNFIADEIKRRRWDKQAIGMELDANYFSTRGFLELQKDLPQVDIKVGNLLVSSVRLVKSELEIGYMQHVGKIPKK